MKFPVPVACVNLPVPPVIVPAFAVEDARSMGSGQKFAERSSELVSISSNSGSTNLSLEAICAEIGRIGGTYVCKFALTHYFPHVGCEAATQ